MIILGIGVIALAVVVALLRRDVNRLYRGLQETNLELYEVWKQLPRK